MLISKTSGRITVFHVCSFTEEQRLKLLTKVPFGYFINVLQSDQCVKKTRLLPF